MTHRNTPQRAAGVSLPKGEVRAHSDSNQRVNRRQSIHSLGGLYTQRLGRLTPAALDRIDLSQWGDLGSHVRLRIGRIAEDGIECVVQFLVVSMPL